MFGLVDVWQRIFENIMVLDRIEEEGLLGLEAPKISCTSGKRDSTGIQLRMASTYKVDHKKLI